MEKLSLNHDSLWSGGPFENAVSTPFVLFVRVTNMLLLSYGLVKKSNKRQSLQYSIHVVDGKPSALLRRFMLIKPNLT
jgi:hypothetical protein